MYKGTIDADDIDTLAEMLEHEKQSHRRKGLICFSMFMLCLISLAISLVAVAARLAMLMFTDGSVELGSQLTMVQFLAPLAAIGLSFFGAWWATQNCLNSIERTLFAARNKRPQLFAAFLEQIQCADKEKRRAWLEIVKSAVM